MAGVKRKLCLVDEIFIRADAGEVGDVLVDVPRAIRIANIRSAYLNPSITLLPELIHFTYIHEMRPLASDCVLAYVNHQLIETNSQEEVAYIFRIRKVGKGQDNSPMNTYNLTIILCTLYWRMRYVPNCEDMLFSHLKARSTSVRRI